MDVTPNTDGGVWQTVPMSLDIRADREVWTIVYEGDYDSILNLAAQYYVGDRYHDETEGGNFDSFYQDIITISSVKASRKVGGLATLSLSYTILYKLEIWNIDFAETMKDIRCWLIKQMTDSNGNVPDAAYDELFKINAWEQYKNIRNWKQYVEFKYRDEDENKDLRLSGFALKVAQKILKGTLNYPVYAPVITRTTVHPIYPFVGSIGKKQSPRDVEYGGWVGFNGEHLPEDWLSLAKAFLKTAEKSNSNGDGTFTLVEQWIGADELDPDLYPTA